MFILTAKLQVGGHRRLNCLYKGPAQPLVALLDDLAVVGLAASRISRRNETGIGSQLLRVAETADVIDFGFDQSGEEFPDAGNGLQQFHVAIGLRHGTDRGFRLFDPPGRYRR